MSINESQDCSLELQKMVTYRTRDKHVKGIRNCLSREIGILIVSKLPMF